MGTPWKLDWNTLRTNKKQKIPTLPQKPKSEHLHVYLIMFILISKGVCPHEGGVIKLININLLYHYFYLFFTFSK
jgi:hypothetical protein